MTDWHKVKALRCLMRHRKRVYPQKITLGKMPKVTAPEKRKGREGKPK